MLPVHLGAWCRSHGHRLIAGDAAAGAAGSTMAGGTLVIEKGGRREQRWAGAERAGSAAGPPDPRADARWGLAARGALVEAGGPPAGGRSAARARVWADIAPKLYAAAAAAQWDPATAVDWTAPVDAVPPEIERAVIQVM